MQQYESRIINPSGAVVLISNGGHVDDSAAVRFVRSLCREGEMAEVWRGDFCVYSECPETRVALVWPLSPPAIARRSVAARFTGLPDSRPNSPQARRSTGN